MDGGGGVLGAAFDFYEFNDADHEAVGGVIAFGEEIGEDESAVGDDFEIDSAGVSTFAFGAAHDDSAFAAGADIGFGFDDFPGSGAEPFGVEVGVGPGFPDFFRREGNDAFEPEVGFGIEGDGGEVGWFGHGVRREYLTKG